MYVMTFHRYLLGGRKWTVENVSDFTDFYYWSREIFSRNLYDEQEPDYLGFIYALRLGGSRLIQTRKKSKFHCYYVCSCHKVVT